MYAYVGDELIQTGTYAVEMSKSINKSPHTCFAHVVHVLARLISSARKRARMRYKSLVAKNKRAVTKATVQTSYHAKVI